MPEYTKMTREELLDEVANEIKAKLELRLALDVAEATIVEKDKKLFDEHELFLATHRLNMELAERNVSYSRERNTLVAAAAENVPKVTEMTAKLEHLKLLVVELDKLPSLVRKALDGFARPEDLMQGVRDYLVLRNDPIHDVFFK